MPESNFKRPEGCQAAVVCNDRRTRTGGFFSTTNAQLTALIVCGQRSETLETDYSPSLLFPEYRERAANEIEGNVDKVLGAMCLSCPNRLPTEIADTTV